jgi:hypothetical protein
MNRWNRATLSIYSDAGLASRVSAELGLIPSSLHEKGDRRLSTSGREYSPYSASAWHFDPEPSTFDPEDVSSTSSLQALVNQVRGCADALARLRPEYRTVIRWSAEVSFQGNFVIPSHLMIDLGLLGCEFYGSTYAGDAADGDVENNPSTHVDITID